MSVHQILVFEQCIHEIWRIESTDLIGKKLFQQ